MTDPSDYPIEICPKCGQRNRIRPHSLRYKPVCGQCRADLNDPFRIGEEVWLEENDLPVRRLSFELLPPGSWNIDDVIAHYRREAQNLPDDLVGKELEWHRLVQIKSLEPDRCYIGTEMWLGYVLFSFPFSTKVVLECPVEGNATYILSGNWKQMVKHTKQDLRTLFPRCFVKVVHKRDWLGRVETALRSRGQSPSPGALRSGRKRRQPD
jgi:hypothetical protein